MKARTHDRKQMRPRLRHYTPLFLFPSPSLFPFLCPWRISEDDGKKHDKGAIWMLFHMHPPTPPFTIRAGQNMGAHGSSTVASALKPVVALDLPRPYSEETYVFEKTLCKVLQKLEREPTSYWWKWKKFENVPGTSMVHFLKEVMYDRLHKVRQGAFLLLFI